MTDRELLKAAAEAAGYEYAKHGGYIVVDGIPGNWNPLNDDGDAFRLAVKLGVLVDTHGMYARVCFPYEAPLAYEAMGEDRDSSVRRPF